MDSNQKICPKCQERPVGDIKFCPECGTRLLHRVVAGRYKIEKLLTTGGMGAVYLAEHLTLKSHVALKMLLDFGANQGEQTEVANKRFYREAQMLAALKHPNTVRILDFGESHGDLFIVMEFVEGETLEDLLAREGRLTTKRAYKITADVVNSLVEAHAIGVVHRDIKPANIMIQKTHGIGEIARVLDFGVGMMVDNSNAVANLKQQQTKLTMAGAVVGTPNFLSPEQAQGKELDARSDVYSLGCVLFRMLTGVPPYVRNTPFEVMTAHVTSQFPKLNDVVPDMEFTPDLVQLLADMTEKDHSLRPTATNLQRRLAQLLFNCDLEESAEPKPRSSPEISPVEIEPTWAQMPPSESKAAPNPVPDAAQLNATVTAASLPSEPSGGSESTLATGASSKTKAWLGYAVATAFVIAIFGAIAFDGKDTAKEPNAPNSGNSGVTEELNPQGNEVPAVVAQGMPAPKPKAYSESQYNDPSNLPNNMLTGVLVAQLASVNANDLSDVWGKTPEQLEAILGRLTETSDVRRRFKVYTKDTGLKDKGRKTLTLSWWFLDDQAYAVRLRLRRSEKKMESTYQALLGRAPDREDTSFHGVTQWSWNDENLHLRVDHKKKHYALFIADRVREAEAHKELSGVRPAERIVYQSHNYWWGRICDLNKIIEMNKTAAEQQPLYGDAWVNQCHAYYDLGQLEKAKAKCNRALDVTQEKSVMGEAHLMLGYIALRENKKSVGLKLLKQSLEELPGGYPARNRCSYKVSALQGKYTAKAMKKALWEQTCYAVRRSGTRHVHLHKEYGFKSRQQLNDKIDQVVPADDQLIIEDKARRTCTKQ